jgi:hypothetical protein
MIKSLVATIFALFVLFSNSNAQLTTNNGVVGEELIRLNLTVTRSKQELPANQVPKLMPRDKFNVGIIDEAVADITNINERGYDNLVVIFLPTSPKTKVFSQQKFDIQFRKLKHKKDSTNTSLREGKLNENKNGGYCFTKCSFNVPDYSSIPIVFFVADGNSGFVSWFNGRYKQDLKKFVTQKGTDSETKLPVNNYDTLMNFGNQSLNVLVLPRKIEFLLEAQEILKSPKAENKEVLESLTNRAFKYFGLDESGECIKKQGNDYRDTVNKQFQCLASSENFKLEKFAEIRTKLNWKDITVELGQEATSQLVGKYPSIGIYLETAILVINLVQPLLEPQKLVISSSIAAGIESRPNAFSIYANPKMEASIPSDTSKEFSQAIFFVPFDRRSPDSIISRSEFRELKPETLLPCITEGKNELSFQSSTRETTKLLEKIGKETVPFGMKLRLTSTTNASNTTEVDLSQSTWQFKVSDNLLNELNRWGEIKGEVLLEYNFQQMESNTFPVKIGAKPNLTLDDNSSLRQGKTNELTFTYDSTPECLKKVSFLEKGNSQPIEIDLGSNTGWQLERDNKKLKVFFKNDVLSTKEIGEGRIQIFQYGVTEPVFNKTIKLYPQAPEIGQIELYENEKVAKINLLGDITKEQLEDIYSVKVGSDLLNFDPKNRSASFVEKQAQSGTFQASLILKNGEETKSKAITVMPPRLQLSNNICPSIDDGQVSAEWDVLTIPEFEIDKCKQIPLKLKNVTIPLVPKNSNYNFLDNKPFSVKGRVVNTGNSSQCSADKAKIADSALKIETTFSGEIILSIDMSKLPAEISCPDWKLEVSLLNKDRQQSNLHIINQSFIELPDNLRLSCLKNEAPCNFEYDGDTLNRVSEVLVSNEFEQNSDSWIKINKPNVPIPMPNDQDKVWLRLRNGEIVLLNNSKILKPKRTVINQ